MKSATCTLLTALALAVSAPARADVSSLPAAKVQGPVSYVSGGIGDDQADAFRQAANSYPLELLFAQRGTPRDEYVADVRVTIRDNSGRVLLDTTSEGPFMLARLPSGKYRVDADYGGDVKRQTVDIQGGKHQRKVFVWSASAGTGETTSSGQ
jgi:hypothetical protein